MPGNLASILEQSRSSDHQIILRKKVFSL